MREYFVYILASGVNGTLYVGVTSDLARRGSQHKMSVSGKSFTAKYHVHALVYYESYDSIDQAIMREKNIKAWKRLWKLNLINDANPEWNDLSDTLLN
jgi:putative endonuclease